LEEAAMSAGYEVLIEVDDNILMIVGPTKNLNQKLVILCIYESIHKVTKIQGLLQ